MWWLSDISSSLRRRWDKSVAERGHASFFGASSVLMQQQNDTFSELGTKYEDDIDFNLLLNAMANARGMIFVNSAAAIGVGVYLYSALPTFVLCWVAAVIILSFVRRVSWQIFFRSAMSDLEGPQANKLANANLRLAFTRRWRVIYGTGLVIAGLLWAVLLERAIVAGGEAKYFTSIVIAALAGGSTGVCAALLKQARLYISSLLLPSVLIFAFGPAPDPVLAVLAIVCWATLLYGLTNNHKVHRQALTLQSANSGLVNELKDLNSSLERKVAKRTRDLEYAAMRDPLTDLPNRRGFRTVMNYVLKSAEKSGQPFTIGVIDLDGFKPVNDAFGHAVGDQLLVEVGKRLKEKVGNVFHVARLGGDEFGFILKNKSDAEDIEAFGQELVQLLSRPYLLTGVVAEIGASLGLSRYPTDGETTDLLCQRADYALYFAKQFNKGRCVLFQPTHEVEISQLARIEQYLRSANLEDELYVHFQPIMDIRTGQIHSMESLARWESPELGNVPPGLFIQAAERSGFIVELTQQLVRCTLQHALSWPRHIRVAINLSARDIASNDAVDALLRIVRDSMIDPRRIDFEITETALVCDFDQARGALTKLAALGARIALDDFGTGHSSLSHLQLLPLDTLKIDSSFIANMESDTASKDIVRALLLLCRSMQIDCILEGVETESQLELLEGMGARLIQGFHIARPMPIEDTRTFITEEQRKSAVIQANSRKSTRLARRKAS